MPFKKSLENRCAAVSAEIEQDYGFTVPWTLIQSIVAWAQTLCVNKKRAFSSSAQSPGPFQVTALERKTRRELRREGFRGKELRAATVATVDTLLSEAAAMSEADLDACYAEVSEIK